MLSRRNVRIKVMHLLYAAQMDEVVTYKDLETRYQTEVRRSYELYLFSLLLLSKVAEYVNKDASIRASKHLPSEEDKVFSTKLFDNTIVQSIVKNLGFQQILKDHKLTARVEEDATRLFYSEFAKTEEFKEYTFKEETTDQDHIDILLKLYKHLLGLDAFNDFLDDRFNGWEHDESLVVGAIKKTIKALPASGKFYDEFVPDAATTEDFGMNLLYKTYHLNEEIQLIIRPVLKNWELERVAVLDLIMIKMAICEMLHFETIPAKVTINEYVDISKLYSTVKSKEFINGVLDRVMKNLEKEGLLQKTGRGLLEE